MQVEIWSDVVCPWCYVGKRRFEQALAAFPHQDDVEVVWRSFELDPTTPRFDGDERPDRTERLASKYGVSIDEAHAMDARITDVAASVGLDFHLERAQPANTFDAHRLLHLAAERGVQDAVKERLLRGYFSEGADVADVDTLVRLAGEAGLDADEARAVLTDPVRYADDVRADEREAAALGATGVPFFVIDRRYGVSGAQPTELFAQALTQAWADAHPVTLLTPAGPGAASADGDACADGSCAI